MPWRPATISEVLRIVQKELELCDQSQQNLFHEHAVEPYRLPIMRHGHIESIVVVASRNNQVISWEDVEEGFNISPLESDGIILQHWCNQDSLSNVLEKWAPDIGDSDLAPAQMERS